MMEVTVNVDGMSCEHCVKAITKAVLALNGVETVEVNLSDKTVSLKFDNTKISLDTIKVEIEDQGYDIINK